MKRIKKKNRIEQRILAGILALILSVSSISSPVSVYGSNVWPQKSTAPYYCLDGGKSWKAADRYEIYKYDTLPSVLTETQAKRLFWAYPSNWNALKEAAKKYDTELYMSIAEISSGPNVVKKVKDDANTKFAWIADHPEIEARAIRALEQQMAEAFVFGKEIPEKMKDATSEDRALNIAVPAFQDGPASLNTEVVLGNEFVADIAKIEMQSVWDNGSGGGSAGWVDASNENNLVKSVMGDTLYEITWGEDSIKIHNNGSSMANETVIGSEITDEERYNKTTIRYKITMRNNSGWYTEGRWSDDYLHEWMDFKACVNAPGHQRLYVADIQIAPSNLEFYFVISQGAGVNAVHAPEYGIETAEVPFQVYRHEELFESTYRVKMKKVDDETNMPLKGSQFYLFERFDSGDELSDSEKDGALNRENFNFQEWSGFQIFTEDTTDENGEIVHTDNRSYVYDKTYCDGHSLPEWSDKEPDEDLEEEGEEAEGSEEENEESEESEHEKDANREAAKKWLDLVESCSEYAENSDGTHFHWLLDEDSYEKVQNILETGDTEDAMHSCEGRNTDAESAFEKSGCKDDCERTYDAFINLRFSYTWKEVQARNGYILHGIHTDDQPIEIISSNASEAGAEAVRMEGNSGEIRDNIWYSGNNGSHRSAYREGIVTPGANSKDGERTGIRMKAGEQGKDLEKPEDTISIMNLYAATESNAATSASNAVKTPSNAKYQVKESRSVNRNRMLEDDDWDDSGEGSDFLSYMERAKQDGIAHLAPGDSHRFSYADLSEEGRDHWVIRNHRTEGEIHINKRDMDLYAGESEIYSAYGDTEGDSTLEGAVYGLFAAEDILHPDSDFRQDGSLSNTGIVYKKHDLVSVSETDKEGNASFKTYTIQPGMGFDYEKKKVVRREDISWTGPVNQYQENQEIYGNWWVNRPLILGNYYVKELSRSEGYELSVNGKTGEWTNYGTDFGTPKEIADSKGTAVISIEELSAPMGGEEDGGTGYDELLFSVISSGTTDSTSDSKGYQIVLNGFPKGTEFYRVDAGEMDVTAPRVTGTEESIMRDAMGNIIWKTAENDYSHIKYVPKYDEYGAVIGQSPMMHTEYQQIYVEQIPEIKRMQMGSWDENPQKAFWKQSVLDADLETDGDAFGILKAELEYFLYQNGYGVPVTADGKRSEEDSPVYNVGVLKGEMDIHGITTDKGSEATRTAYGEAVREVWIDGIDSGTTIYELMTSLISWYRENPQWSFGGIHELEVYGDKCRVVLYAGMSSKTSRRFFTTTSEGGALSVDCVYAVYENPKELRWVYQQYEADGAFQYQIERQYSYGYGKEKRYYLDAYLAPAMMANSDGKLQPIVHQRMVYHKEGEEIVDYLAGDPDNHYRVPKMQTKNIIEITTEKEVVEKDVFLENVVYDDKSGVYFIDVDSSFTDSFGRKYSDENESLEILFMAKLPKRTSQLSAEDVEMLGPANLQEYKAGEEIGYAEYLVRVQGASIHVAAGAGNGLEDTYIVAKTLAYRGQHKIAEDGDSRAVPVQVLERPIKQKVKVIKKIEGEDAIQNFRFKIFLKSNLERLFCEENGEVTWLDTFGKPVSIDAYKDAFPELVQKIYTKPTDRMVLERIKKAERNSNGKEIVTECYNYEKFFDAVDVANTDKWNADSQNIQNTSSKPFAYNRFTNVLNKINSSEYAVENAKRSDAVRQFAVTWYLEGYINMLTEAGENPGEFQANKKNVTYADEIYDEALYRSILDAEEYLNVFFRYDLDAIYSIAWDCEMDGGADRDKTTLSADQLENNHEKGELAYGISPYLPYGEYVLTEQQPYKAELGDLVNRQYKIDTPKEISLPVFYDEQEERIHSSLVPWSITEPGEKEEMSGYAAPILVNRRYGVTLRVEKYDKETGEPILHAGSVFALYKADRNDGINGDGCVKRYEKDTLISGSRPFLQAMGASEITPFGRIGQTFYKESGGSPMGVGVLYSGRVPAGTPICREEDCILFGDMQGIQTGQFSALSTIKDCASIHTLQTTGYFETPEQVEAGVYVLAELLAPAGYVKMKPVPVEVYSDAIVYYPEGNTDKTASLRYGDWMLEDGVLYEKDEEFARIYMQNTATSLAVSKIKTLDTVRRMKVSGRVEGSISALNMVYGLENLELAYNSSGIYLGFGWKKGTLEYLKSRKQAGERIELVYEDGVFQGYGYVIKTLESSKEDHPYVTGATLALFEAIEIQASGDTEDYAWRGIEVVRDSNGNVTSIVAREGFAGERLELLKSKEGIWSLTAVPRKDTPVLFYDLSNLKVLERAENGKLYGYDREGQKVQVTFDTTSIYAIRDGRAEFEITGGNFWNLIYDKKAKSFANIDDSIHIYHLDSDLCRDALVDGHTGMAYIEAGEREQNKAKTIYVWPIHEIRNPKGQCIAREKILTGRPGEKMEGTENAYITGMADEKTSHFEKKMSPVYDRYGLVDYYPEGDENYKKGSALYDRDGEYMGYWYEDLLELFNTSAYGVLDPPELYHVGDPEDMEDDTCLQHRQGEAWIIPNIWISGQKNPQDPLDSQVTQGKEDILRRVVPGTYIMEELSPPEGYSKALPAAVSVKEDENVQRVSMTDERIKVEIAKIDGTDAYKKTIVSDPNTKETMYGIEGKSAYSGTIMSGVKLALFKAERIYTSDYMSYPKGYYLKKVEDTPASWYLDEYKNGGRIRKEAVWITGNTPQYFEGIPAGDYILEELYTPAGFIPAAIEITIENTPELQSFLLYNDHTKLEIFKYRKDEDGIQHPLEWPAQAGFALYPALVDQEGNVLTDGERYLYDKTAIAEWKTGGQLDYAEEIMRAYESMFQMYRNQFQVFSWKIKQDGEEKNMSAHLRDEHVTENGETVTQIWKMEDETLLRITVNSNDGRGKQNAQGYREPIIEYQFHYNTTMHADGVEMISYDSANGIHRLDYIPAGTYILVEEAVPDGYEEMAPKIIRVENTEAIQRIYVENREEQRESPKGTLIIEKRGNEEEGVCLAGAWFQIKNLQTKTVSRVVTDESGQAIIPNLPVEGIYESGISGPVIYEVQEIIPPDGYCLNPTVWQVHFSPESPDGMTVRVIVEDRQTEIVISKSSFNSEHFVPGAELAIFKTELQNGKYVACGDALERWVSGTSAHVVKGKLSAGQTYLFVEEEAPAGYVKAEPIRFTISEDGTGICEISKNLTQIQVIFDENKKMVERISVTGHEAYKRQLILRQKEDVVAECYASGEEIDWMDILQKQNVKEDLTDHPVHVSEYVLFADGSRKLIGTEYFRINQDSGFRLKSRGHYPVGTEYALKDREGILIDRWFVKEGVRTYQVINEKSPDGDFWIKTGQAYLLEERIVYENGERVVSERMSFEIDMDGNVSGISMSNQKTSVVISKLDSVTGKLLPGSLLAVRDQRGDIVKQWNSGTEPHGIEGICEPDETYILEEMKPADGYAYAEDISFTISPHGGHVKIYMEDTPTHVEIRKTDIATGEELPGAELVLKDAEGVVVDQWISGKTPHVIKGKLLAGETYTLIEVIAPQGYELAEEVTFTVSKYGSVDRVVMEDRRKEKKHQEEGGMEHIPKDPEMKKYGIITATYQMDVDAHGKLQLNIPSYGVIHVLPKTGDEPVSFHLMLMAVLALTGCLILLKQRGDDEKEEI